MFEPHFLQLLCYLPLSTRVSMKVVPSSSIQTWEFRGNGRLVETFSPSFVVTYQFILGIDQSSAFE